MKKFHAKAELGRRLTRMVEAVEVLRADWQVVKWRTGAKGDR